MSFGLVPRTGGGEGLTLEMNGDSDMNGESYRRAQSRKRKPTDPA